MNPYYNTTGTTSAINNVESIGVYMIIAIILGIIGSILIYFLFLNPKKEDDYQGFVKKLYDFLSFKTMTLEHFLKILYLFNAIFITIFSLSLISVNFLSFLLVFIVGNILARMIAEGSLLILMIYRRLNDINNNVKPKSKKDD